QGSPLFLAFQAFLHVRGAALEISPLAALAGEERQHFARALAGVLLENAAQRAAALVTLCQGLSPGQIEAGVFKTLTKLAVDADAALAFEDAETKVDSRRVIEAAVRNLYGGGSIAGGEWIAPVLPDILGERIVAEALADAPSLLTAYFDAHDADAVQAFIVLNRISRP
ncbi:MAG: hypothetical protein AAFW46_19720, partial [Pseudomonadota bacterium]